MAMIITATASQGGVHPSRCQVSPSLLERLGLVSFDVAQADGQSRQANVSGACDSCRGYTSSSYLPGGPPPRPDVEGAVDDGVHAGVGAGEEEQSSLYALVHVLGGGREQPVPETVLDVN